MGTRAVIELVEELVQRGGGFGLFAGCAAGDSAMAVVIDVLDRRRSYRDRPQRLSKPPDGTRSGRR